MTYKPADPADPATDDITFCDYPECLHTDQTAPGGLWHDHANDRHFCHDDHLLVSIEYDHDDDVERDLVETVLKAAGIDYAVDPDANIVTIGETPGVVQEAFTRHANGTLPVLHAL